MTDVFCFEQTKRLFRLCATIIIFISLAFQGSILVSAAEKQAPRMAHGFAYHHDENREKPWSIHVVKVDLSNRDLELHTTLAKGNRFGMALLSEQIRTIPKSLGRPVAAINGDYHYADRPYAGDPKGLQILRGELVSGPCDWTCFWMDRAGVPQMTIVVPHFQVTWPNGQTTSIGLNQERASDTAVLFTGVVGPSTRTSGGREIILGASGTNSWLPLRAGQAYTAQVREVRDSGDTPLSQDIMVLSLGRQVAARAPKVPPGSLLQISTATSPDLTDVKTAIGGGPPIVRGGKVLDRNDANVRHPRAAIGWNKNYFFLVEVDGRQRSLSVGMTNPELAEYMIKLGCDEAMSLDGGGSATCWVYGQVMNSPSEGHERPMANALVLVQKEKK